MYTGQPEFNENSQFFYSVKQSDYDITVKQVEKVREQHPEWYFGVTEYFKALFGDPLYPLTIVSDRYGGGYSGGLFTAWLLDWTVVPDEIDGCDPECNTFWNNYQGLVGKGRTPQEAYDDLRKKIIEAVDSISLEEKDL